MTLYVCVMVIVVLSLVVTRVFDRQSRQNKDFKMVFVDSLLTSQSSRVRANIHFCDGVSGLLLFVYICIVIGDPDKPRTLN